MSPSEDRQKCLSKMCKSVRSETQKEEADSTYSVSHKVREMDISAVEECQQDYSFKTKEAWHQIVYLTMSWEFSLVNISSYACV